MSVFCAALLFLKPICIPTRAHIVLHAVFSQLQLENAYEIDNSKPVQIPLVYQIKAKRVGK